MRRAGGHIERPGDDDRLGALARHKPGQLGESQVATLRTGDVFGEISAITGDSATATVTARTRGEVLFLPGEDLKALLESHPDVRVSLEELSQARLQALKAPITGDLPSLNVDLLF